MEIDATLLAQAQTAKAAARKLASLPTGVTNAALENRCVNDAIIEWLSARRAGMNGCAAWRA